MTSRSYTKSYSRKVSSVTPASIQFDKLFKEHSNRPSAAKSAGTVGKWGITSFTSIRSTNINGRRDDIHSTFPAKKMKMDYGNQNARVTSGKDPFSFDADPETKPAEVTTPVVKPKKFFKSRNVQPIVDDIRPDAAVYRQVPDSQYGRVRTPKQSAPKSPSPKASGNKKLSESSEGSDTGREESNKPPIVLRICKGTARLVSGDSQNPEPDQTLLSSPVPSPVEPDDFEEPMDVSPRSDPKQRETRSSHQPVVTTVSIPLENSEMRRTTRSRAKNLQLDLTGSSNTPTVTTPTTPNSHSSGLSLTLRKSVTDSNNTLISHYDIVKTDCNPNYPAKSAAVEPLIGHDQPLPTTTQELIDILSSDADPLLSRPDVNSGNSENEENENASDGVQHCSIDIPTDEPPSDQETEPEAPTPVVESDPQATKAMVDQDWFSGSEDSNGIGGNVENDCVNVPSPVSEPLPAAPAASIATSKPATKKGSIFKSRSTGAASGNKRLALYKHKWCDNEKEGSTQDAPSAGKPTDEASGSHGNSAPVAFEEEEFEPSTLTRVVSYPETDMDFTDETEAITSIRCGKKVKGVSFHSRDEKWISYDVLICLFF